MNQIVDKRNTYSKNEIVVENNYAKMFLYNRKCDIIGFHIFDIEDIDRVKTIKWYLTKTGYVKSGGSDKPSSERNIFHRFVLKLKPSNKKIVDHINKNKLDNRKTNLRQCTMLQNTYNSSVGKNNTSKFIGVSFVKEREKYVSQIMVNRKHIFLGYSEKIEDAVKIRLEGELKYFGEYSPQKHLFEKYGVYNGK